MSLETTYMLRLIQTWGVGGKRMENVFFYDHTAGDGVAIQLAQAFEANILPNITNLQCDLVKNVSLDVINMGNFGDFISWPLTGQGEYAAEALPPHSALNFTMKLNTRAVRKGSKRISGIPETVQINGVVTLAGYIARIETFRVLLDDELVTTEDTWLPVVIKRVKEPVAGTVPVQYTYRLPETNAELVVGQIVTATTTLNISHQVSRSL